MFYWNKNDVSLWSISSAVEGRCASMVVAGLLLMNASMEPWWQKNTVGMTSLSTGLSVPTHPACTARPAAGEDRNQDHVRSNNPG